MTKKQSDESESPTSITQTMTNSPGGAQAGRDLTIIKGMAPWRLTEDQCRELTAMLKPNSKGSVVVRCINGDPDSCVVANQLLDVLKAAGWTVSSFSAVALFRSDPLPLTGIHLNASSNLPAHADVLFQALRHLGIPVEGNMSPEFPAGKLDIMVGVRPPEKQS